MKKRFHVKKRTLLLIAGIVWLIAGFNVARLGILSYRVIEYSRAMKSHFRKFGNQMSGSGNHLCNYASLLA